MKQLFLIIISLLLFSCNREPQIEGKWYYYHFSENNSNTESPETLIIRNDSIIFNYPYFDFLEKYYLSVQNSNLHFKDFTMPFVISSDTLVINGTHKFTKEPSVYSKEIYENKSGIKIELPQLIQHEFRSDKFTTSNVFYKFYGFHPETNKQYLLINDVYTDNFFDYLSVYGGHEPSPIDLLFVDKNTIMLDLEKLFIASKFMNQLKVVLVNDVKINFTKSNGINYKYSALRKTFCPNPYNTKYYNSLIDKLQLPEKIPPLPPSPPKIRGSDYNELRVITLQNNGVYIDNIQVNEKELKRFILDCIEQKAPIISLYNLNSTYSDFLSLNLSIKSLYNKKRQALAHEKYSKDYSELNEKETIEIKKEIPIIHFWDYSISHFDEVIKEDGTFFGFKIK